MSFKLDDTEKMNLEKMIKEYQTESTTDQIREKKHSVRIEEDINQMSLIKTKYKRMKPATIERMIANKCSFLKENYRNIYNRLLNDSLDITILREFISILREVENGVYDQHEASAKVGEILKQMYIDPKLSNKKIRKKKSIKNNISWSQYKQMNLSMKTE